MSPDTVIGTRTYLEMTDRLRAPCRAGAGRRRTCRPPRSLRPRALALLVFDRGRGLSTGWTGCRGQMIEIRRYLSDPAVSLWVLTVGDALAGYFELRREDDEQHRDRVLRTPARVHRTRPWRVPADRSRRRAPGHPARDESGCTPAASITHSRFRTIWIAGSSCSRRSSTLLPALSSRATENTDNTGRGSRGSRGSTIRRS